MPPLQDYSKEEGLGRIFGNTLLRTLTDRLQNGEVGRGDVDFGGTADSGGMAAVNCWHGDCCPLAGMI